MKMLWRLIIFGIVCWSFKSLLPPAKTIRTSYDFFTTDNLGNVYAVKGEEIVKYLPDGKMFARYSNLKFGNVSSIDVTNPLKILVYYRDFQQLVFLDNQLSVNSENVSLEKLGYEQTEIVCAGANNSFWIYNKQNNELLRFDENSKKISATGNLKQVLRTDLNPGFMLEQNNFLYLNSPGAGIFVFDIFGAFVKVISLTQIKSFQVAEDHLYFQRDSSFCSYNQKIFEEQCEHFPLHLVRKGIRYSGKKIYLGASDSLIITDR